MTELPHLLTKGRVADAVLIPVLGIGQAVAMGIGAFATCDAFTALYKGYVPDVVTLLTLALCGGAVALMSWLTMLRAEAIGQSYVIALRKALYQHIAGSDLTALERRRLGASSLSFIGDLSAARSWFGLGLPHIWSAAVVVPGAMIGLWLLNPMIAQAVALPLAISVMAMLLLAIGMENRDRVLRTRRASVSISMMERIAIAPVLDLMGRTPNELNALNAQGETLRKNALSRASLRTMLKLCVDLGAMIAGVLVLVTAGKHGITPGIAAAALAVIAIILVPLRNGADAWESFCSWRLAKGKALTLLQQPSALRQNAPQGHPVAVTVMGRARLQIPKGRIVSLNPEDAPAGVDLLRVIAGLDRHEDIEVSYGDASGRVPAIGYIGPQAPFIQGSLHHAATLGISPRPSAESTKIALAFFGVAHLVENPEGLKMRVEEAGRNLTRSQNLRLEMARMMLAEPDLILIDGDRLASETNAEELLNTLKLHCNATIVMTGKLDRNTRLGDEPVLPKIQRVQPNPRSIH